jgi:S-adenosylmethionine synthetase
VAGGHGAIFITGEVTSSVKVDVAKIAHRIAGDEYEVIERIVKQSPEIARGVDEGGAGDQGIMVGYACDETPEYLPLEYVLARDLNKFLFGFHPFDGKTQITAEIKYGTKGNFISAHIKHIVVSWSKVPTKQLCADLTFWINQLPKNIIVDKQTGVSINPAGDWDTNCFDADSGLTGRKLVVDNYGPRVSIGGGAFSGKDATKVDRSAAYKARQIAVDILNSNADLNWVQVQLSYAIGIAEPVSIDIQSDKNITTLNINKYREECTPERMIKDLHLNDGHVKFYETAKFGHFGIINFPWEER